MAAAVARPCPSPLRIRRQHPVSRPGLDSDAVLNPKKRKRGSSQQSLFFVNITHPDQSKDSGVVKVVRQHAMHNHLLKNPSPEPSDKRNPRLPRRLCSGSTRPLPQIQPRIVVDTSSSTVGGGNQTTSAIESAPPSRPLSSRSPNPSTTSSKSITKAHSDPGIYRPVTAQGLGFDPFQALPQTLNPRVNVQKLKRSCVLFFGSEGMKKMWVPRGLDDPLFFLSSLCIAARHEDVMVGKPDNVETLALETQVFASLNERLKDPEKQVSDNTIAAVAHIACACGYRKKTDTLDWYQLLHKMVEMRGGLQELGSFPGLAGVIIVITLGSSVYLERPVPLMFQMVAGAAIQQSTPNSQILESPLCSPDGDFSILAQHSHRCSESLLSLLRMSQHACALAMGDIQPQGTVSPTDYYGSQRDCIRALLLTFQSAAEAGHDGFNDYVYESCRLAMIIMERALYHKSSFSTAAERTYLPLMLKTALMKTELDDCWGEMAGVLLWVAYVGAAAATGAERGAFGDGDVIRNERCREWLVGIATRVTIKYSFSCPDAIMRSLYSLSRIQAYCRGNAPPPAISAGPMGLSVLEDAPMRDTS